MDTTYINEKDDYFLSRRPIKRRLIRNIKDGSKIAVLLNDEDNQGSFMEFSLTGSTAAINQVKYCEVKTQ